MIKLSLVVLFRLLVFVKLANPDPRFFGSWIWIRIREQCWIRIRNKVLIQKL
jgi:hypothetical protein